MRAKILFVETCSIYRRHNHRTNGEKIYNETAIYKIRRRDDDRGRRDRSTQQTVRFNERKSNSRSEYELSCESRQIYFDSERTNNLYSIA
jgi:hypothetical protein